MVWSYLEENIPCVLWRCCPHRRIVPVSRLIAPFNIIQYMFPPARKTYNQWAPVVDRKERSYKYLEHIMNCVRYKNAVPNGCSSPVCIFLIPSQGASLPIWFAIALGTFGSPHVIFFVVINFCPEQNQFIFTALSENWWSTMLYNSVLEQRYPYLMETIVAFVIHNRHFLGKEWSAWSCSGLQSASHPETLT